MTSANARTVEPVVAVPDRLQWTLEQTAAMVGRSTPYVRALEAKGEFPPRLELPAMRGGDGDRCTSAFVAAEVRAWAAGLDWRRMVDARNGWRHRRGA